MNELEKKVRMFHGIPPYHQPSNIVRGDGYFWSSVKARWSQGEILKMEKKLKVR